MKGALYSPGFPNYYPSNQNCTVTLDVPDNFKTIVWFQSFFLQYHQRCEYDKLVISDELGGNTQCGGSQDRVPAPMELRGRKVQLAFTTNEDSSASGFYLKYNITKIQQGKEDSALREKSSEGRLQFELHWTKVDAQFGR